MTLQQFAQTIIDDDAYRTNLVARARAGLLPPDIEMFLIELADGRYPPMSADRAAVAAPAQGPTFALIRRPSAVSPTHEENSND